MNFSAIYHRTSDNLCYPLNESELIINIKTGFDIKNIILHYGDPFSAGILGGNEKWTGDSVKIINNKNLQYQLLWSITIKPTFKRCKYYFELNDGMETWYYFEDGFLSEQQLTIPGKRLQCFIFPWMNTADINRTPYWVKDTVWYQIFPDRFCNGDYANDMSYVREWKMEEVKNEYHYGGDLAGITKKLEYLADLGITGIYLNPIFHADSTHKYDTIDYMKIDPQFGDNKDFDELVKKAHSYGIRIMIDGVFNHCGSNFGPWLDVLEKGPKSKYYHWFMINEWPFDKNSGHTRDGKFYSFAFTSGMPKLNTNEEEVIEYLVGICEYWVKHYDIDGIRLDVANEVSHKFAKELRKRMKALKPDIYILGEIWHDSIRWLLGDEFDSVMNYPLTSVISGFWQEEEMSKDRFEYLLNNCYSLYMEQTNDVMFQLLDSHDTERLIYRTKDIDIYYQQLALLLSMQGSPCIYYGTEIAMDGAHDPDCRRCMPWDDIDAGVYDESIQLVKELIRLRNNQPELRSNKITFTNIFNNNRVLEFIKTDENGEQIQVIINGDCKSVEYPNNNRILLSRHLKNGTIFPKGFCFIKI